MFDDKLRATYCICSSFAKWSRLLCKLFEEDAISTRNTILELSQSLPYFSAAAGSDKTDNGKQKNIRNALTCALELSSLMQKLPGHHKIDEALLAEGVSIIDAIISRLTNHLPNHLQVTIISAVKNPARVHQ